MASLGTAVDEALGAAAVLDEADAGPASRGDAGLDSHLFEAEEPLTEAQFRVVQEARRREQAAVAMAELPEGAFSQVLKLALRQLAK